MREAGKESPSDAESFQYLNVNEITPNPFQPRIRFDEGKLKELSETIRQNGLIQPIVVRKAAGRFEIVSGERRWQATKLAQMDRIPVIVRRYDDRRMLEAALIENLEREDLNPVETAKAIRALQERFGLTQDQIAEKLSKDRSTISNLIRLLALPDEIQTLLLDGKIEFGHAKAVLSIQSDALRIETARKIAQEGWSVRKTESEVRRLSDRQNPPAGHPEKDNSLESLEQEFSRLFGTAVSLKLRRRKGAACRGSMEIRIQGREDVDRILGIARKGVLDSRSA